MQALFESSNEKTDINWYRWKEKQIFFTHFALFHFPLHSIFVGGIYTCIYRVFLLGHEQGTHPAKYLLRVDTGNNTLTQVASLR